MPDKAETPGVVAPQPGASQRTALTARDGPVAPSSSEARSAAGRIGTFHSLRFRDYRLLWMGTALSSAGQWLQQVTLGWVVYDLTGSGTLLGGINGMRSIAMLGFGPFGGVVVDRVSKRGLMLGTKACLMLGSLLLGAVLALGWAEIWHLFAFMFFFGAIQVFDQPLRQTLMFELVPRQFAPNAVALMQSAFSVTRAIGPAIGGFFILWFGPEGNFFLQAGAYLLVAISVFMIAFPQRHAAPKKVSVMKNFVEGLSFIAHQPTTRTFLLMGYIPALLLIPIFTALTPIYAKDVFHGGPHTLGYLTSAVGVGGVVGALLTASLGQFERRGVVQLLALAGFSGGLFAFSFSPSLAVALVLLFAAGGAEMVYLATNQTLLQLTIPDELRGRITSILMLQMGLMPLGSLFAGIGADLWGPRTVTQVMTMAAAAAGLAVAIAVPSVRNLKLSQVRVGQLSERRPGVPTARG